MSHSREWSATEHTIRRALVAVSDLRHEAEGAAADALTRAAMARLGEGNARGVAEAAEAAARRAASAEAHYEEALALWYTCPNAWYYQTEAGRYTAHALTQGWVNKTAARGAAGAAAAAASEADMFAA